MIQVNPQKTSSVQLQEPIAVNSKEAARLLSISPRTLFQMTKDKKIPATRVGRKWIYSVEELRRFVSGQ